MSEIHWLQNPNTAPQRLILAGQNLWPQALKLSAKLNDTTPDKIESEIEPDVLVIKDTGEKIKIGDEDKPERNSARGIIKWANQTPVANFRIVLVENIERATLEATQSLLKVIEEPPQRTRFIFTTPNQYQILPTILSRMTVVNIPMEYEDFLVDPEIKMFFNETDLITKFQQIEELDKLAKKLGNRQPWFEFTEKLIFHARFSPDDQAHLEHIFQAHNAIKRNGNPRLTLENLALQIHPD